MIISWNWLRELVPLDVSHEDVARRLMLAGLNHESTEPAGDDFAIDLEVTSNRPDCLGHIGVAREAAVLFEKCLSIPAAKPAEAGGDVSKLAAVRVEAPQLCPRYTARVIRGVKIGSSPAWLVKRLATLGIAAVNNVVDVTNNVLMECGQPLHAFDLAKLHGAEIVVRRPKAGEKLTAINHREYALEPEMCVIADRDRAVALAGVMGGAETEVSSTTKDILLEAALFDPSSIRATARKLALHSPSSYRFERGLDPEGVDWASRRACELILQVAGGALAAGVIDVNAGSTELERVTLRYSQLKRVLGIEIPAERARQILEALGARVQSADERQIEVIRPSWRRDLTREIDLVEEVARIHGYDAIPEDVNVPMAPSTRTEQDRILSQVRFALTASGFDEALTLSVVDAALSEAFSPWTEAPPLLANMPVMRGADRLRRSLVPSLLDARRVNQSLANQRIELFETAKVYLPRAGQLPDEQLMLALTSGQSYLSVKGTLETMLARLNPAATLEVRPVSLPLLDADKSAELWIEGELLGYLGELSDAGRQQFDLRSGCTVAEVRVGQLVATAKLIPQYHELSAFPAVSRDLNLVVDEAVRWADLALTARGAAGEHLESLEYQDTYRDEKRLGAGKKSLLLSIHLRSHTGTLTSQQADAIRDAVVTACQTEHSAQLRA